MLVKCVLAFPTESAKEVLARYGEGPTWPDGVTAQGPFYFRFLGEGLRALTIFEIPDDHAAEALAAIRQYPKRYLGIPGFTYIVDMGLDAPEFMQFVGVA